MFDLARDLKTASALGATIFKFRSCVRAKQCRFQISWCIDLARDLKTQSALGATISSGLVLTKQVTKTTPSSKKRSRT